MKSLLSGKGVWLLTLTAMDAPLYSLAPATKKHIVSGGSGQGDDGFSELV